MTQTFRNEFHYGGNLHDKGPLSLGDNDEVLVHEKTVHNSLEFNQLREANLCATLTQILRREYKKTQNMQNRQKKIWIPEFLFTAYRVVRVCVS